jgi:glycosyltransferase involved in cell wall biosynthesis
MNLDIPKDKPIIIISAINVREGGPLSILKECLNDLSNSEISSRYLIIALVHSKQDCLFPNIKYFEYPKSKSRIYSYYREYMGFRKMSIKIGPLLWLSLNDKTPNVETIKRAVYIHNPTPFFNIRIRDIFFSPFLFLYVHFYKKICKINISKNNFLIVQQDWLRIAYSKIFNFDKHRCVVFPPPLKNITIKTDFNYNESKSKIFLFASVPRGFKNFEIICEANKILLETGVNDFSIILTLLGNENRYAKSIFRKYGHMKNIVFKGIVNSETLSSYYKDCDCLIFPSRLETWGLPISEFSVYDKPMLLADLPYAHNTSAGSNKVAFFDPNNPNKLAVYMKKIIEEDYSFLKQVEKQSIEEPYTHSWEETIQYLINN